MLFKKRSDSHVARSSDLAAATNEAFSKQAAALRAAVASVRADLSAEVARRISAEAEADLRLADVVDAFERRLGESDTRNHAELESVSAELTDNLTALRASHLEEAGRTNAAHAALATRIDEHARKLQIADDEQATALASLGVRLSKAVDDVATELRTAVLDQTAATEAVRDSVVAQLDAQAAEIQSLREGVAAQSTALDDASSALEAQIAAAGDAHSRALDAAAATLNTQIAVLTGAQGESRQALDAANAAHSTLASIVADQHEAVVDRVAASEAVLEHVRARLQEAEKRVDDAVAAAARVDTLADLLDEIRDRLSAAETTLLQRDGTDIDLQLDRMESFERFAAETNPDLFAAKAEVDDLRARLTEIERNAGSPPAS